MGITHLTLQFGPWHQRRDGVDDKNIDGTGPHKRVGNLKRLFTGVRLRDQQLVNINAKLAGIGRVERVFSIDEGTVATVLLRLGNSVQRQRCLARGFRAVDLDDPAFRKPADTKANVQTERAGRDGLNIHDRFALPELHHRALAERLLDLADGRLERF